MVNITDHDRDLCRHWRVTHKGKKSMLVVFAFVLIFYALVVAVVAGIPPAAYTDETLGNVGN